MAVADDPFAAVPDAPVGSVPFATDQGQGPAEGFYRGKSAKGETMDIRFGDIGQAIKAHGFMMDPGERTRYRQEILKTAQSQGISTQPSDKPLLGPATGPAEPAAGFIQSPWRFLKGAGNTYWDAAKGMWQAVTAPPQNDEERELAKIPGQLTAWRLGAGPLAAERAKAAQIKKDLESKGHSIYDLNNPDAKLYWEHMAIGQVPLVGPMAMGASEGMGQSIREGDIAGAVGKGFATATMLRGGPEDVAKAAYERAPAPIKAAVGAVPGIVKGAIPPKMAAVGENVARNVSRYLPDVRPQKMVGETIPRKLVSTIIRPAAKETMFGKDPVKAVLDENLHGNLEELGQDVNRKLDEVGKKLDATVRDPANVNKVIDMSSVLTAYDDAIAEAIHNVRYDLVDRLKNEKNRAMLFAQVSLNDPKFLPPRRFAQSPFRMSPVQALEFKRWFGSEVKWDQDPLRGDMNQVFGDAYGKAKNVLNNNVPGMDRLNERYANLVGARKAITRRELIHNRNSEIPLSEVILAGTGHPGLAVGKWIYQRPGVRTGAAGLLWRSKPVISAAETGLAAGLTHQPPKKTTATPTATVPVAEDPFLAVPDAPVGAPEASPPPTAPPVPTKPQAGRSTQQPPQTTPQSPFKQWKHYAKINSTGQMVVSDDGRNWFDLGTGRPYQPAR